jgi:thymidylate synthase (FAD)
MKYVKTIPLYNDNIGSVSYVEHMGSDLTVVNSARVSFGVEKTNLDNRDRKLINYLIKHKHTSTLEHNVVSFRFIVPLFVRSQHHRHRTWSYNEISRRYTDKNIQLYLPTEFRTQHSSNRQASNPEDTINPRVYPNLSSMKASELLEAKTYECLNTFEILLDAGVCKEQARMILPKSLFRYCY